MVTSERDMNVQASETYFGNNFMSAERIKKQDTGEYTDQSPTNKRAMGDTAQRIASLQVQISPKKNRRESPDRNFSS